MRWTNKSRVIGRAVGSLLALTGCADEVARESHRAQVVGELVSSWNARCVHAFWSLMTSSRKPRSRSYHHGDLRAAVLRATVAVIEERGGVDFSMREIADQAGATHPALYKHFADKRALLVQIAIEGYELLDAAITAQVEMSAGRAAIACEAAAAYISSH